MLSFILHSTFGQVTSVFLLHFCFMWTLSKIINIIRISWKNSPPTNKSEESFGRGTFLLTHTDDDNDDNDDDGDDDDDDDDDGAH